MNNIMGRVGMTLLALAALFYVLTIVNVAIASEEFGVGFMVLAFIGGCALLLAQAIRDRAGNKEDDYYSKNVEK